MHMMGTNFVGKVRDVRQIAEEQIGEGVVDMVEFMARVNGHKATEKANKIQVWYNDITHSDEGLGMGHQEDREGANTHLQGANQNWFTIVTPLHFMERSLVRSTERVLHVIGVSTSP